MYLILKHIHITAVVLTAVLFFVRGVWMLFDFALVQQRWVRFVPHIIDTVLLASAVALTFTLHQYPFINGWLTAKVCGLLVYIALGMVALHYGKTKWVRFWAWLAAMMVFAYVVFVAVTKHSIPWI